MPGSPAVSERLYGAALGRDPERLQTLRREEATTEAAELLGVIYSPMTRSSWRRMRNNWSGPFSLYSLYRYVKI